MATDEMCHNLALLRLFVSETRGWQRFALAFVAGGLSVLAFAPVHAFPILFATLPVFVWLIDGSRSVRAAAFAGWAFGFGYFFFNLFWIGEAFLVEAEKFAVLLPIAVSGLPAGLAIFWALAAAAAFTFWRPGYSRVLVFAIALSIAEWLRGHILTGLPWNVIGYALTYPLSLMQSAALFGVYALTPIAIVIFALPLVMLAGAPEQPARSPFLHAALVALMPLTILTAYGNWRLASSPPAYVPGVKIRLVQPSVPQREKWQPQHQREIFDRHLAMSLTDASGKKDNLAGITHVVWPEAAMPFLPLETPQALNEIGSMLPDGAVLISGALRRQQGRDGKVEGYNSLIVFDGSGNPVATYDKVHLVPFGEYLPFEPLLSAIGLSKLTHGLGSFATGTEPRPLLSIPGLPAAGGLICYEVLFPGQVADRAQRPSLFVNVTNDGWFGDTTGPRQHFHQTRVRAVEEGLPVIRVANNGISAVIDPMGRVEARLELNARGVADAGLPVARPETPFVRFGDLMLLVVLAGIGLALANFSTTSVRPKG